MSNRIKEWRQARGFSQEALAERLGTSGQQVSRLERAERGLTDEWMQKIATALAIKAADLLPIESPAQPDGEVSDLLEENQKLALLSLFERLTPFGRVQLFGALRQQLAAEVAKADDRPTLTHEKPRRKRRRR